jgi:hypothetical protein
LLNWRAGATVASETIGYGGLTLSMADPAAGTNKAVRRASALARSTGKTITPHTGFHTVGVHLPH